MSWQTLDPTVKAIAIRELTEAQLRVLQDRLNGHSFRTIARATGRHEATVRGHWDATLDRLAPHINEIRKAAA